MDTTSVYVYRDTETEWRKRGYSRDHRPDLPQLVLGVAVDREGRPVSWEVFPGNTADPEAFEAMITKLRGRFRIGRVVVVADRGMMGKKSLDLLASGEAPFDYILGCRMRNGNGKLNSQGHGKQNSHSRGKQKSHALGKWNSHSLGTPVRLGKTLQERE